MKFINRIISLLVGGLFIFSGLIKLNDPVGTAIKMQEYFEVFSADISPVFHYLVPLALGFAVFMSVLEVVLGVALLINWRPKLTIWTLLLMIVFFTFLTFYSAYFNKVTDCGCFGDAIKLTPWESFTKDVILLVLILIMLANLKLFKTPFGTKVWKSVTIVIITLVSTGIAIYAIEHLPFLDFRAYKKGVDIEDAMLPSEPLRYKYIMTKDGQDFEFESYPTEPGYEYKSMELINPEAQPKITDYSVWNDEGEFTEETFIGNKLLIIMYDVNKADKEHISKISQLAQDVSAEVTAMVLTASTEKDFERFRHEYQLAIPYYYADATVLKTMVRSNPGLLLLKNGQVLGKWHHNDVPSKEEVLDKVATFEF